MKRTSYLFIPFFLLASIDFIGPAYGQNASNGNAVSLDMPSGWVKFDVAGVTLVSRAIDKNWITNSLNSRPTTQPAVDEINLVTQIDEKRDYLVAKILKDSSTLTPSQVEQFIDKSIRPKINDIDKAKSTIVFYVFTEENLKQALISGWRSDYFKYDVNQDELLYSREIKLDSSALGRDIVIPATYNGSDPEQVRIDQLQVYVQSVENAVKSSKNSRETASFVTLTADFLKRESFKNLSTEPDQVWFVTGLTNVLAVKYLSDVTKVSPRTLVETVINGPLPEGVRSKDQDLLQPLDEKSIKEAFLPAYKEARKRKAIAVVFDWYQKSGPAKLSETLLAIDRLGPADGQTLVKIIKDVSDIDLSSQLTK